jgi:phage terminase large subunit
VSKSKIITLPYNFVPREYQQEYFDYFDHGGRFRVDIWHRRAGKDLVALHQAVKMAHERKGMYWHCLPSYAQARKTIWNNFNQTTGERLLRSVFPREIVKHPEEFRPQAEMLIELKCGSMFQFIGSDGIDSIVGAGPQHVTMSEYALCRPNTFDLIRPMLRQNGGSASFITTPRGKNHAFKQWEAAKRAKGWSWSHKNIYDTNLMYRSVEDAGLLITPDEMMAEERAAGMQEELIRQEYLCDWEAALVGSVWGDLMEQVAKRGGIVEFTDHADFGFLTWDLGINDSTAIWFWTVTDGRVDFIDHYETHGKGIDHFFDVVDARSKQHGVKFRKMYVPHDARQRSLQTGVGIIEQFWARYGHGFVEVLPPMNPLDGVQAGRWLLQREVRFHPRCNVALGIEALKQYHYEYDDKKKTYSNRPEHDWSSHTADAFRYTAFAVQHGKMIAKALNAKREQELARAKGYGSAFSFGVAPPEEVTRVTLDQLYKDEEFAGQRDQIERIP